MTERDGTAALHRVYVPVLAAVFAITWLKGFRFPNLWSATHFAFNYSQGFVRRGLVGEVARQIGGEHVFRYSTFVAVSFVVFFATGGAFALAIRRALRADPHDWGFRVAALVFVSSPALVFFVHTIGYNDYFGALLVLGVVLVMAERSTLRFSIFYLVLATSVVAALIHEGLAIMFGPVLMFAMGCHILKLSQRFLLTRTAWAALIMHAVITSAVLLSLSSLVSTIGVEDLDRVQALQNYVVTHADFPVRPKAFDALMRSSSENLRRLMPWYWSVEGHWTDAIKSWQAFALGFAWLLAYGATAIARTRLPVSRRWILVVLFVAASFAPLAFNFVGWDWGRWNGLALVACFMTILTCKLYFPSRDVNKTHPLLLATGLIVGAIGLASTTPLFDGFSVQFFPFTEHQQLIRSLIEDGFQYRPRG